MSNMDTLVLLHGSNKKKGLEITLLIGHMRLEVMVAAK